jgi:hypothetical protein
MMRELARRQRNELVEKAFKSLADWSRAQDDRYQRDEVKRIQKGYNIARNRNYDRYNFNIGDLNEEGMKAFNRWFQHVLQRDIANLPADEWEFRYKFRGVDRWGRRQLNAGTLGDMFQQLEGPGLGEEQPITFRTSDADVANEILLFDIFEIVRRGAPHQDVLGGERAGGADFRYVYCGTDIKVAEYLRRLEIGIENKAMFHICFGTTRIRYRNRQ